MDKQTHRFEAQVDLPAIQPASSPLLPRPAVVGQRLVQLAHAWAEPLRVFVGWRLSLGLLAFLAALLVPAFGPHNGVAPYTPPSLPYWQERLLLVWSHWDGEWFLHIAQSGYLPNEASSPFFPLYPLIVRAVAWPLGDNFLLAGVLTSAVLALVVFGLFYELVGREADGRLARQAIFCLAVFPTSFYLAACYSEGLFLALALGAFLAARHWRNWWLAGILVGLAAVTRNLGILLVLPLGWEWLRYYWLRPVADNSAEAKPARRDWSGALFSLFGLGVIPALLVGDWLFYQWVVLGDPLRFIKVQSDWMWRRGSALPWQTLAQSFNLVLTGKGMEAARPAGYTEDHNLLDLAFWLFQAAIFLVAIWQSWRKRLAFSYLLYFAIALILPLTSPSQSEPLMSTARFALVAFPLFIVVAQLAERWRTFRYSYLFASLFLLALLFSRFANWYWVA